MKWNKCQGWFYNKRATGLSQAYQNLAKGHQFLEYEQTKDGFVTEVWITKSQSDKTTCMALQPNSSLCGQILTSMSIPIEWIAQCLVMGKRITWIWVVVLSKEDYFTATPLRNKVGLTPYSSLITDLS